jgi:hypothetical protein
VAGLARLVAAGVEVTNVNTTVTVETLPLIGAWPARAVSRARHRAGAVLGGPAAFRDLSDLRRALEAGTLPPGGLREMDTLTEEAAES